MFFFGECEGKVFEASNETNHWKIQPISFIPQIVSFSGRKTGERKTERRRIIPTKEKDLKDSQDYRGIEREKQLKKREIETSVERERQTVRESCVSWSM
jgi:primosomal protein N''